MTTYTLTSVKHSQTLDGDLADAFRAAIAAEIEHQPAYGITIEGDDGRTFECRDEQIAVYAEAGEDSEEGHVVLVDDALMIAWEQGTRTPFADTSLQAA